MSPAQAVRRALISVWDKRGLVDLAKRLRAMGVELISSGGTAATLEEAGLEVTRVADVTGSPEILGGRVKTLHPMIHGAILADRDRTEHLADLEQHGIVPIDLVVINLYPFEDTVAAPGTSDAEAIEKIDIGGPTMVRAAAKNHAWVAIVTSPDQYEEVAAAVESGGPDADMRRRLAAAAFAHTTAYDAAIVAWMERGENLPERIHVALERSGMLRYGENPSQAAAVYRVRGSDPWWEQAIQHQGKAMSFNNYADAEAAWRLVNDLADPTAVIVKHTNPCGVASRTQISDAFRAAWDCDPLSAFGGIIALNRPLDGVTAGMIGGYFVEVVIAPALSASALDALAGKRNLRVLEGPPPHGRDLDLRGIEDGMLAQVRDRAVARTDSWEVASRRPPTADERADLEFAWVVAAHTKSNAVVVAADRAAVGVGGGDQSRVGAAERALARAGERAMGGVAASDAFFPFRDGLDVLAAAGITAVVEPGGSRNDAEVVAAADERGMALLFTGERHFRH